MPFDLFKYEEGNYLTYQRPSRRLCHSKRTFFFVRDRGKSIESTERTCQMNQTHCLKPDLFFHCFLPWSFSKCCCPLETSILRRTV
ncbi:hypothetical protein HOLleu_15666 [Holothuria leucospilota]|uniref:Uncharacterized protein n=1 Tax=Holothuria leucospilota TaxID=206669 RepID=A0A9Q1C4L7_HOLLE|nr:hypothetical protein HOLleu_15666 [Holothuria leucospilota]